MTTPHLLLVEDDMALAELVSWHFDKQGFRVSQTADGEEAMLIAREERPDIVLLDWMIENLSGIEVCRRLRRDNDTSNIPIIMMSRAARRKTGCAGSTSRRRLCHQALLSPRADRARHAVLRRVRPALAGEALSFADIEMDTVGYKVKRAGQTIPLGPTEFRLLRHFLEHPGWVFSRERLLDSVWGHDSDIEIRTVDVHIRRLRKALNANGQPDIIRTVRSAGYALDSELA